MTTTTAQYSLLSVPQPLAKLFSYFPLKTYPPSKSTRVPIAGPLLWIHPPPPSVPGNESVLSADIECLKWQAHIALRGLLDVSVRWDISQEGALGGRLPNLRIPSERANDVDGELLAAQSILAWIDEKVGPLDDLEGYKDGESRDESHAWIALLEGDVHAALVRHLKTHSSSCVFSLQLPIGARPTTAVVLLSCCSPATPVNCPAANRDHPYPTAGSALRLLVPPASLRRASLPERYFRAIPRRNRCALRAPGAA